MSDLSTTLQVVNIVLTALSPIIISIAYCLKRVTRSKCCNRLIELEIRKRNDNDKTEDSMDLPN